MTTTHPPTPGQTVGPFFGYALPFPRDNELAAPGAPGATRLHGRVLDGAGQPVPDAVVELWQTDPAGRVVRQPGSLQRDGWTFTGWGRTSTDREGRWSFTTLRPGTPFFAVTVLARGLTNRLFTRAYLPEHADDPFLLGLPEGRRSTLLTAGDEDGWVFDIRLQGDGETVFLAFPRHDA